VNEDISTNCDFIGVVSEKQRHGVGGIFDKFLCLARKWNGLRHLSDKFFVLVSRRSARLFI